MAGSILLRALFAMGASLGFAVLLNIERKKALVAALGGALSWLFYELAMANSAEEAVARFFGSLIMGLYSEIMARKLKSPATIFYIPGFVPLVPGSNAYYSVLAAVQRNSQEALNQFVSTLIYSTAIALGLIMASAMVAIYKNVRRTNLKTIFKEFRKS